MEPRRNPSIRLKVRAPLSNVSLIYAIRMKVLARELTGKSNLKALFDWCGEHGVGVDGFLLNLLPGGNQGEAWLDARRQRGVFFDRVGNVVARLVNGQIEGDESLSEWLAVLPSTAPGDWERTPKTSPKPSARGARGGIPTATLTAKLDVELTSRAQLEKLTPAQHAQLAAASKELCGKKGLTALMRWCDAEGQGLAHVVVHAARAVQYEAWLTASLEDGAFFDAGETKLNGLTVSQGEVSASVAAREPQVPALHDAMSKLRVPRAPKWVSR